MHDIIAESKQEPHVELIVLRRIQPEKSVRHPYSHQRRGRNQGYFKIAGYFQQYRITYTGMYEFCQLVRYLFNKFLLIFKVFYMGQ